MSESILCHSEEIICFIPCRSGSKGLRGKNFLPIGGKPLVLWAVELAKHMGFTVIVAPDDEIQAGELRKHDVHVYLRDKAMADGSHQLESWALAHETMETHYGMSFEYGVMLEPSSPCRQIEDIRSTVLAIENTPAAGTITINRKLNPNKIRQFDRRRVGPDLGGEGEYCQFNGICYAATRSVILEQALFENIQGIVTDHPAVNIDDWNDFQLAEAWLKRLIPAL